MRSRPGVRPRSRRLGVVDVRDVLRGVRDSARCGPRSVECRTVALSVRQASGRSARTVRDSSSGSAEGNAFLLAGDGAFHLVDRPDPGAARPHGPAPTARRPGAPWTRRSCTPRCSTTSGGIPDTPEHIAYIHDTAAAVEQAERDGGTAVLMHPVREEVVRDLARAGRHDAPQVDVLRPEAGLGPGPAQPRRWTEGPDTTRGRHPCRGAALFSMSLEASWLIVATSASLPIRRRRPRLRRLGGQAVVRSRSRRPRLRHRRRLPGLSRASSRHSSSSTRRRRTPRRRARRAGRRRRCAVLVGLQRPSRTTRAPRPPGRRPAARRRRRTAAARSTGGRRWRPARGSAA